MLEKINLESILEALRQQGASLTLLYAEQREERVLEFFGRQQKCRLISEAGTRLETHRESLRKVLTLESISTPEILLALGSLSPTPETPTPFESRSIGDLVSERNRLEQVLRKTQINLDSTPAPSVRYVETKRRFLTGSTPANIQMGQETSVQLDLRFQIGSRSVVISRAGHDIKKFWERLESDPYFLDPCLKKGWENPWPAPQGKLPVLWSPEAVSKLLFHFIRTFDLKNEQRFNFRFDLEDRPDTTLGSIDHSGAPKIQQRILEKGAPSEIHLRREGRGFSRRSHFSGDEAKGFWNVSLLSDYRAEKLLPELQMGVYVQDLYFEFFDPKTAEAILTLTNASLIHHGTTGEAILPVTLRCSLLDLFSSWELFSKNETCFGYGYSKNSVRMVTETTVPEAFSREFYVPGTVSPSHYW